MKAALTRVAYLKPEAFPNQLEKPEKPGRQLLRTGYRSKFPVRGRDTFNAWDLKRPERDKDYFEYDPSTERLLIICMPSAIHEAAPSRFIMQVSKLSCGAQETVELGTIQRFSGFNYPDVSIATGKEADAFLRVTGQEFPFLVLKAGWSEPKRDLIEDARLWLWVTNSVNFVIIVESVEENALVDDLEFDGGIKLT